MSTRSAAPTRYARWAGLVGFALFLTTPACSHTPRSQGDEASEALGAQDTSDAAEAVPCFSGALGSWRVTGHHIPGISALTEAEARSWYGKRATFAVDHAVFDGERCADPTYSSRPMNVMQLAESFRLPAATFDQAASGICLVEVGCPTGWSGPASLLLQGPQRLIVVWDGVFFDLAREESSLAGEALQGSHRSSSRAWNSSR